MGLFLCVFSSDSDDTELDSVEVGGYDDFDKFRRTVAETLERDGWGSRFPTLMNHPDSDRIWGTSRSHRP